LLHHRGRPVQVTTGPCRVTELEAEDAAGQQRPAELSVVPMPPSDPHGLVQQGNGALVVVQQPVRLRKGAECGHESGPVAGRTRLGDQRLGLGAQPTGIADDALQDLGGTYQQSRRRLLLSGPRVPTSHGDKAKVTTTTREGRP
jgi:hypothetical protein